METDLLSNVGGNFQTIRNMWSTKVQEEQQLLKPKPVTYRSQSQLAQKQASKIELQSSASMNETIIHQKPMVKLDEQKPFDFKLIEESPSVNDEDDEVLPLPAPPPSIVFKEQIQSIVTLKQSVTKMFNFDKKKPRFPDVKNNGIRHWHIARHVFRSGLIFGPTRRASDSILPLLIKTRIAHYRSRANSLDSVHLSTPLEGLIDYLTYDNNGEQINIPEKKSMIKRTTSDTSACIERNKLNDTIAQYETIMRHLKNYDTFMATYPAPTSARPQRKSMDIEQIMAKTKEEMQPISTTKSPIQTRQTQSLARNAGRTFTDFIMNDLLLSPLSKTSSNDQRRLSTVHAASQTDLTELIPKSDVLSKEEEEETKEALNELDTVIQNTEERDEVTSTDYKGIDVVVVVVNPPVVQDEIPAREKPLMQRLFEGKKAAYTPTDLQMETVRMPEDLLKTYEIAKKKCFFPAEELLYATKMTKIDRRGYKQHLRILSITSERVYIITKKDPYPKEAVSFKDILGISCTPRQDGFVCLHTRETREDRGDWIFILEYPCEFITQLFMAMGRNDNDDQYLKIKDKFHHTRRGLATTADDCTIEARPSDTFRIAFEDYEILAIYSP